MLYRSSTAERYSTVLCLISLLPLCIDWMEGKVCGERGRLGKPCETTAIDFLCRVLPLLLYCTVLYIIFHTAIPMAVTTRKIIPQPSLNWTTTTTVDTAIKKKNTVADFNFNQNFCSVFFTESIEGKCTLNPLAKSPSVFLAVV